MTASTITSHPSQIANEECRSLWDQLEKQSQKLQAAEEAVGKLKVGASLGIWEEPACEPWLAAGPGGEGGASSVKAGSGSISLYCLKRNPKKLDTPKLQLSSHTFEIPWGHVLAPSHHSSWMPSC